MRVCVYYYYRMKNIVVVIVSSKLIELALYCQTKCNKLPELDRKYANNLEYCDYRSCVDMVRKKIIHVYRVFVYYRFINLMSLNVLKISYSFSQ